MLTHNVKDLSLELKACCVPKYPFPFSIFQVHLVKHETLPHVFGIIEIPILEYEFGSLKIQSFY